jgi:hypothetical protein
VGVAVGTDVLRFLHETPPLIELGMPGLAVDGILIVIGTQGFAAGGGSVGRGAPVSVR